MAVGNIATELCVLESGTAIGPLTSSLKNIRIFQLCEEFEKTNSDMRNSKKDQLTFTHFFKEQHINAPVQ